MRRYPVEHTEHIKTDQNHNKNDNDYEKLESKFDDLPEDNPEYEDTNQDNHKDCPDGKRKKGNR